MVLRTSANVELCVLSASPCDKDELFNRGLQTYMMRRAGVLYVNIQTVLREGIALRLRRPGRCEAWS